MTTVPARGGGVGPLDPRRLAVSLLVACAVALPFMLWGFRTYQLAFAATHAIAILGLNLITGQAGLISLGHGAFYGLGAYTMAVLMRHGGVSAYAGIPAAALVCLAAGYLFGRLVAPLARFYLALATLALALAMPQTLKSSHLSPWTGGVQGLYVDRPSAPLRLPVDQDQWWYFVTLGILALLLWLARNLIASPAGRAIRAMRDDPVAAQVAGIHLAHHTAVIFAAQLTTNMAANVVSPSNDFSNLNPKRISYVTGGLITALIGVLMMPWKVMASMGAYIFTWLIGYSGLMGAIAGILICDYWVLRSQRLSLADLFNPKGIYSYANGINWRAMITLVSAIAPVVPGFIRAATTPGGQVSDPTFFDTMYTYAWFVTFGLGFVIYYVLMNRQIARA